MQLSVDASGAFLNNGTLCVQTDTNSGKILIDPRYGIIAGTKEIYTVSDDGSVSLKPAFIGSDGKISFDTDHMPNDVNFFLDVRDGKAYFRGNIYAENGYFNGEIHATSGVFKGTIEASTLKGHLISDADSGGWLIGSGIAVGDVRYGAGGAPTSANFYVDAAGNVNIKSGSISWGAVTGTDEIDQRIENAQATANSASSRARTAADNIKKLANGTYTGGTFIDGKHVVSPYITGGRVAGTEIFGGIFGDYDENTAIEDWSPHVWIKMGNDDGGGYGMNVWSNSKYGVPILRVYDDKSGGVALQVRGLTLIQVTGSNEVKTPYFHYTLA